MPQTTKKSGQYILAVGLVTSLFFLWAFIHNINPILIPHLKKACQLTDTQSSLIDVALYLGYFIIAIPAGLFLHKYGYKNGILVGLFLFALGAFLFVPAASARSYIMFLVGLFVFASGATFLETVANPYMTKLGDPAGAEQRLNFAQAFNGVGAFIAPYIGGQFILSGVEHTAAELKLMSPEQLSSYLDSEAAGIKIPYIVIGSIVLLVCILFMFIKLPEIKEEENKEGESKSFSLRVFRHAHVTWGVLAQFFYVGAQVCIGSFFIRFSKYVVDMPEKKAANLLTIALIGFMAGRFVGTFLMKYVKPAKLLSLYAAINVVLLLLALFTKGTIAVYSLAAVPFFESIMFPTIFALGIKGLGEESKFASSFQIMAIVGGAVFPFLLGMISDKTDSIQLAYIVPLLCFAFVLYYGISGHKIRPAKI